MTDTLATIIATAVALGWILLMVCAAVLIGHLFAGPPEVMLADTFAEHEDEPVEVDGPTSRPYIPLSSRHVWPQPPAEVFDQPDDVWEIHPSEPKSKLHRLCVEAYADRRYSDICKTCTPRMGVRP